MKKQKRHRRKLTPTQLATANFKHASTAQSHRYKAGNEGEFYCQSCGRIMLATDPVFKKWIGSGEDDLSDSYEARKFRIKICEKCHLKEEEEQRWADLEKKARAIFKEERPHQRSPAEYGGTPS